MSKLYFFGLYQKENIPHYQLIEAVTNEIHENHIEIARRLFDRESVKGLRYDAIALCHSGKYMNIYTPQDFRAYK